MPLRRLDLSCSFWTHVILYLHREMREAGRNIGPGVWRPGVTVPYITALRRYSEAANRYHRLLSSSWVP